MKYFEEYGCGCSSAMRSKKELPGYCPKHGSDRKLIYRQDGEPADKVTHERLMKLKAAILAIV